MIRFTRTIFFIITVFTISVSHAQEDSASKQGFDCMEGFFNRSEKPEDISKITVVTKNLKTVKLPVFLLSIRSGSGAMVNPPFNEDEPKLQEYGLIDLDNDGKKELVVNNYTGGAHCCDEFYFFKNIGLNKYQFAAKTFAGDVCVSDSNIFSYSFYQQLGYFFTCFACEYTDTTDEAPVEMRGVLLKYKKGKLNLVPGDQEMRSIINDNLGKLGEQPYEKIEGTDLGQDNGLRKEVAMNLAVYYYSFGKNIVATQALFNKYYKFPDKVKVWTEFKKQLQFIQKENNF